MAADSNDEGHSAKFLNIPNFRDSGQTVNDFLGRKLVRTGLLYRSARPDDATPSDRRLLKSTYGIKSILDLRTKTEHINAAKKRNADQARLGHVKSNDAVAEPLKIPGIRYLEIKLTGKAFEKYLLSQLSWPSYLKLIFLYIFGFRMKAISIMGREVMQPRGLVGLAGDTLDHSGTEIKEALESFLEPAGLPALVHCTQGKDRTGIIIILALMVLQVPDEAIDYDYQLSEEGLVAERESRLAEIREIGLSEDFGGVAKDMITKVRQHLNTQFDGLDNYLDGIEFGREKREKLRDILAY